MVFPQSFCSLVAGEITREFIWQSNCFHWGALPTLGAPYRFHRIPKKNPELALNGTYALFSLHVGQESYSCKTSECKSIFAVYRGQKRPPSTSIPNDRVICIVPRLTLRALCLQLGQEKWVDPFFARKAFNAGILIVTQPNSNWLPSFLQYCLINTSSKQFNRDCCDITKPIFALGHSRQLVHLFSCFRD